METWQSAIFYTFLGYLLFHMVVEDIIHFVRAFYPGNRSPHQKGYQYMVPAGVIMMPKEVVSPAEVVEDGYPRTKEGEKTSGEWNNNRGYTPQSTPQPYFRQAGTNQRTIVLVVFKICDVILYCLMGYFHTFTTCWWACITCLDSLITKYIAFLESMVQCLTAYPGVIYLSGATVCCMGLACVIVYFVF